MSLIGSGRVSSYLRRRKLQSRRLDKAGALPERSAPRRAGAGPDGTIEKFIRAGYPQFPEEPN